MQTLREVINQYRQAGKAIGHFNFSDSNQLKAIAEAAKEARLPVVAGLSEGEREYFTLIEARGLIDAYIEEGVEIYLNADHTYSLEKAKAAIDAGVDSIVVDGAKLSMDENIALTKAVVEYARGCGRDVLIEGELGYIGSSSKQLDELPEGVSEANLTTPEDAKHFMDMTGIDALAPAVGNVHGMLKSAAEPHLHPERVKAVAEATGLPLILHGASGNTEEDIAACIKAGIAMVHINTELRVLYHDALQESLAANPTETTPYKFLGPAVQKLHEYLVHKMQVLSKV